jgi:hypothetical protein
MSDPDAERPEGQVPVQTENVTQPLTRQTAQEPPQLPAQPVTGVKRGGTAIGIVLVCLGAIMLFGRYVPWLDLFRLWPLIIVIGGVAEMVRPHREPVLKRVAEGAGTVAVGLVLLGNTFGYIPWTVWITMLSLWPLLLVALGIELLGRGFGLTWVRALSNVVLLLGLLYGVFVLQPGTVGSGLAIPGLTRTGPSYSDSRPHDTAVRDGSATIKAGATLLKVGAGTDLARIGGNAPADAVPTLAVAVTSGTAAVTVQEPSRRTVVFGIQDRSLDLMLDREVTWKDVEFDVGAVQAQADLGGLVVEKVSANVGASDLTVTIGDRSRHVSVDVSGGVANVTLRVPASAEVTLDSKSGLSNVAVPAGFRRLSGIPFLGESSWRSDGSGGPQIAVTMQSGVSNLTIETY